VDPPDGDRIFAEFSDDPTFVSIRRRVGSLSSPSLRFAKGWYAIWESAMDLATDAKFPISAYLPLVRALLNELEGLLRNQNSGANGFELAPSPDVENGLYESIIRCFNMTGIIPDYDDTNRGTFLLTKSHIWCYLVDPFRNHLSPQVWIDEKPGVISDLLDSFIPGSTDEDRDVRSILRQELSDFLTESGPDAGWFDPDRDGDPLVESDNGARGREAQKKILVRDVREWIDWTNGYASRLTFFGPRNLPRKMSDLLYTVVVEPLRSMRPAAPITSPRVARAFQQRYMDPDRRDELIRVGLNLRFLYASQYGVNSAFLGEDKTEILDVS
jgi:hypothetical protein